MIAKNWDTRTISVKISSFRKFDLENWTRRMDGQDLFLIIMGKKEKKLLDKYRRLSSAVKF